MSLSSRQIDSTISPQTFSLGSAGEFRARLELLYRLVEHRGYAILRAWDTSPETLTYIAGHFGRIQRHPKADATGVVTVSPERPKPGDGFERNVSKTPAEFQLHTDGAFIDGVVLVGDSLYRLGPPCLFLLQCVQPAEQGGTSVLVDTQQALAALKEECPYEARMATEARVLTYFGGDQIAMDFPLFERQSSGAFRVRFRADLAAVAPWAKDSIRRIVDEYLLNDRFAVRYQLQAGDILIVDNQRMIHGRDAIALGGGGPTRLLRRAWIWDEANRRIAALRGGPSRPYVAPAMEQYAPIENELRSRLLALGVKI